MFRKFFGSLHSLYVEEGIIGCTGFHGPGVRSGWDSPLCSLGRPHTTDRPLYSVYVPLSLSVLPTTRCDTVQVESRRSQVSSPPIHSSRDSSEVPRPGFGRTHPSLVSLGPESQTGVSLVLRSDPPLSPQTRLPFNVPSNLRYK